MSQSWNARVESYVDELETAATTIDQLLQQCKIDTESVKTPEVQKTMQELTSHLARLEELVAQREALLEADDAPVRGNSLTTKLNASPVEHSAQLGKRCEKVAHLVADVNHRAVSLFICQYHLAEFGNHLIRLIAGEETKPTYTVDGRQDDAGSGGGLLNEAA